MLAHRPSRLSAVLLALFVTVLWSSSWVLIKLGLQDIPALTFAGLRYVLAFLCLLPFALRPAYIASLRAMSRREWARLAVLGILFITVAQGAQFLGLALLPAVTVSLLLNFTPLVVAALGIPLLGERPSALQWGGIWLYVVGVLVYFYPMLFPANEMVGLGIVLLGVLSNALSSLLGRDINRDSRLHPLIVTVTSMGIGATALLASGMAMQGMPTLSLANWAVVAWLAVVNTALAFPLWNYTLRTLTAVESSVINNTMLVQITILAWLFLDETLTWQDIAGLALVAAGTLLVQLRFR